LLVRENGDVVKTEFTVGKLTPWGPMDHLLIR